MYVPVLNSLLATRAASSAYNTTIQLPTHKPENAEHLSPQLAAFSIEMDRWPDWAGYEVGKPNEYTMQIMRNLGERTGVMPFLRVGANSEDRTSLNLDVQTINSTFPEPTPDVPRPEADHNEIGKDFYALSGNFPAGTSFHWGINLRSLNKSDTIGQARLLGDTFQGSRSDVTKDVKLEIVEIGNEPDVYGDALEDLFGVKGPLTDWTPDNYTNTWVEYAQAVQEVIRLGADGQPKFSPGGITGFTRPAWTPGPILNNGLLDDANIRAKTSQFGEHSYFGGFSAGRVYPPGELMNTATTRSNFSAIAVDIKAVRDYGLKFVLTEMNSYANHGIPGLSNTLESAIWAVDFMLLAASYGVERCHFHHGVGFAYNTFQPIDESDDGTNITRPHTLPIYNGFLAVNEAIGKTGDSWIAPIGTLSTNITSYGVYENKQLSRVVVINHQVFDGTGERSGYTVNFDGWADGKTASVKRLTGPVTQTLGNVTWGGQSFETVDAKPDGEEIWEEIDGSSLYVEASSVALIQFK